MNYWIDTNLTFEYELTGRSFKRIALFAKPWRPLLRLLETYEQANILCPDSIIEADDKIAVWGVVQRHRDRNIPNLPGPEVVMNANSKIWCFENRTKTLPHAAIISQDISPKDLRTAISFMKRWIIKDPFGVAGRERFNGDRASELDNAINWMKKSKHSQMLLEPYVEIDFEFSVHYEINTSRKPSFVGASALLCDKKGVFRGNYTLPLAYKEQLRVAQTRHKPILEKLAELGYRGPLSFDAYIGTYNGDKIFQTTSEINARYTFGRMYLELQRRLDRRDFLWWHPSPKVFSNISKSPLETQILMFPLIELNDTGTILLSPIEAAMDEIKTRTNSQRGTHATN